MFKPIRWYSRRGYRPGAIVKYDGDYVYVMVVDTLVRVRRIPLREEKFMRPLIQNGQPYPPEKLKASMEARAARLGITKSARRHLDEAPL